MSNSEPDLGFLTKTPAWRRGLASDLHTRTMRTLRISAAAWPAVFLALTSCSTTAKLSRSGKLTVMVKRGGRTVKRTTIAGTGTGTNRLSIPCEGIRAGDYVVTVTGTARGKSEKVTLTSRRI